MAKDNRIVSGETGTGEALVEVAAAVRTQDLIELNDPYLSGQQAVEKSLKSVVLEQAPADE